MMTLRVVNSGTGYEYLLRSVATNDGPTDAPSLSKYYDAKGTPPGRWLGSGLAGLNTETVSLGGEVTESQMAALYGEGLHPDADMKMSEGQKIKDVQLGRPFANFTNDVPVLVALRDAERRHRQTTGTLMSKQERAELVQDIGRDFFIEEHGVEPQSGREVVNWVNGLKDNVRQSVSGFDLTFSPAKSVSVAWALSDEKTARRIEALHHQAVSEAIAWAEDNALFTRVGKQGREQVKTKGFIASEFKHYDTRAGDPDLHSHVLVSNKVQTEDGRWLSIDGYTLMKYHQSISHRYDSILNTLLSNEMGYTFTACDHGVNKEPTWEIDGISESLMESFSKRRRGAHPVYKRLVEEFVAARGATPNSVEVGRLWQQAILKTRDAKREPESLTELRAGWKNEVSARDNGEEELASIAQLAAESNRDERPLFDAEAHLSGLIDEVLDTVVRRRSYFRTSHVATAAGGKLQGYRFASLAERDLIHATVVEAIVRDKAISLNDFDVLELPEALKNTAGKARDTRADSELYTTQDILDTEDKALAALNEPVAAFAPSAAIDKALDEHEAEAGFRLNSGQESMARYLLTCGTLAATGVGPAGTGKTASMRLVANVWANGGRNVIGLAPSAQAADVLSKDLGFDAFTIDKLTYTWRGNHPTKPGHSLKDLPVSINAGDMIIVDEAGMASTPNIGSLLEIAEEAGAVVRFIGDHKQLGAVENGGLFGAMVNASGRTDNQLSEVVRFGGDSEQSATSLRLREGDSSTFDFYAERGWVNGGARGDMLDKAAADYLADISSGKTSLLIAATNRDVAELNETIRAHYIANGEVDTTVEAQLSRGEKAGLGDTILARKNQTFYDDTATSTRINNGTLLTVTGIAENGSITARNTATGEELCLPADYVHDNVQLGYAATVYRAQGSTVDCTRAVIDHHVDRAGLYVALTRGKIANHIYAVTEHQLDELAEEGHYHYQGIDHAPSARDVFNKAISRDTTPKAAREVIAEVVDEQTSPDRMMGLWLMGKDEATNDFIDAYLPDWIDTLPGDLARKIEASDDGVAPIRYGWAQLIDAGIDPRTVMDAATRDIDNAHDPARLIRYRLDEQLRQLDTGKRNQLPPISRHADVELDTWLRTHNPYDRAETTRLTGKEHNLKRLNQAVLAEHARFARAKVESLTWQEASITTLLHEDTNAAVNEVIADYQKVRLDAGRIRAYEQAMADHSAALGEEDAALADIEHQRLLADDYTRPVAERAYDHDAVGYGTYQQRINQAHTRLDMAQQRRKLAQQAIEDTGANLPEAGLWEEICYHADDAEEWDKRLREAEHHDSEHTYRLQQRLDTIRREKMDWADRADIATRLRAEEIPNDVADHAGYIADEVNLLAAQRTYELRRLGVDEPSQETIRDMVAETIAAAYEPDNDDTHHDEQDTTVQNTVEEAQPAPETTPEADNTDNTQDEDAGDLHQGAQASLDFLASLGLGGEQQSVTSDSDTTDEQAPADDLEEEQGPEL
ncbi:MobF family relaxase [Corynebacterium sp. HMSC074A09]|uniref:MobF family relaxase n=1 Tax=Corynebacterium sp. HMSC074A09 TaxID=1739311 RepID=UPI0008A2898E|nr:MobF family relaxase [Corynebacterium sp. HMSC074A09]OFK64770.1 conjugal transfer protein TraA [Corynebacterium sp. HMSC074A09]